MNERVVPSSQSASPRLQPTTGVLREVAEAAFADILAGLRAHEQSAGPAGLTQVVRKELKNAADVNLGQIASDELKSPAGTSANLAAKKPAQRERAPARSGTTATSRLSVQSGQSRHAGGPSAPSGEQPGATLKSDPSQAPKVQHARKHAQPGAQITREPQNAAPDASMPGRSASVAGSRASSSVGTARVAAIGGAARTQARMLTGKPRAVAQSLRNPVFRVEKQQMPSQISRSLARIIARGGGRLTLRLNPRALGDVRAEVHVHHGVARAIFQAETESARKLLSSQLDALRSALERRGVRVERLEVENPRSESAGSTPEASRSPEQEAGTNGRDERAAPDRGSASLAQRASAEADENDRSELEAEPGSVGRQSLNVEWSSTGSVLRLDAIA